MAHLIGSLITLFFGAGILAVAVQGHRTGVLPAGAAGWRAYRPNRNDNPFAFRLFLLLYCSGGMVLAAWGILALFGAAPALALR
jgi:hypothetical protein